MGWPVCNSSVEYEEIHESALWHGWEFHRFGLALAAAFAVIAVLVSWYLIYRHATHYLKPWEQRHIIRILFMVPVYAVVSFLSYYYYRHAVYFEVIRDCYEAFAIASFFALLCHYIAPDLHSQKDYFRVLRPRGWLWPLGGNPWFKKAFGGEKGLVKAPRSGLTWFNIIWLGVFQYCFVRVFMTVVSVISQAAGRYCSESLNPAFAHVWVMVIEGLCVSVAMYCLIQYYWQLKADLAEHSPFKKILAIKLVIFLSFWQSILISFLTSAGAIHSTSTIANPDIKIGIPSLLLCIEMAIFSIFHLFAFPWSVYNIHRSSFSSGPGYLPSPKPFYQGGRFGYKALFDAFNPWDLVKSIGRGFRWMAVGRKHRERDISYKQYQSEEGTGAYGNQVTLERRREDDTEVLRMNAQPVARTERNEADMWPRPGFSLPPGAEGNESRETLGERPRVRDYGQETGVVSMPHLGNHSATVPQRPYAPPPQGQSWDTWGGSRIEEHSARDARPGRRF